MASLADLIGLTKNRNPVSYQTPPISNSPTSGGNMQELDDNGPDIAVEAPPPVGNAATLIRASEAANNPNIPQRKGMFGVKGTLRDVLGLVGDSLLIGAGNKPIYAPTREQERLSDAMVGYTNNPKAAIERVSYINAEIGQKLADNYEQNLARRAAAESLDANRKAAIFKQYSELFGQRLGAIRSQADLDKLRPILQALKDRGQLGDDFIIPETYDPNEVDLIRRGTMTTSQQEGADNADARLAAQREYQAAQIAERRRATAIAAQRAAESGRHNRAVEGNDARRTSAYTEALKGRSADQARRTDSYVRRTDAVVGNTNARTDLTRSKTPEEERGKAGAGGGKYVVRNGKLVKL